MIDTAEVAHEGLSAGTVAFRLTLALGLVLANGFFVASEFALVGTRKSRVLMLAETGDKRATRLLRVISELDAYISATQLGITLASLALGWVGEKTLVVIILPIFEATMPGYAATAAAHTVAVAIAFAIITFMHIVLGELAPKTLALERAEAVALAVAWPMEIFYKIFKAPIMLLNWAGNRVVKLFGLKTDASHSAIYTEEEIRYLVDMSHKGGHLNAGERELIHNVFEFAEGTVRDSMIPRAEITLAHADQPLLDVVSLFESTGYSRIPVLEGGTDTIVGAVHGKDVLTAALQKREATARELMRPVLFVPPSAQLDHVLARMKRTGNHIAIVVDEHGGFEGIVTLEDILEEIVGEIRDEFDEGETDPLQIQPDGTYLIDGATPIRVINRKLELRIPESNHYSTLAGFLLTELGTIPTQGQFVPFGDAKFVIETVRRHRVVSVRLIPSPTTTS